MTDAIVYSSTDPLGPGVQTGSTLARLFNVLYACLVTGYGDKPGQGWTLVDNGGSLGVTFLSPDGVFVVFRPTSVGRSVEVYLAEHLSSPYTYPPVGTNVRSQDYSPEFGPGVIERHLVHIGSSASGYSAEWWSVIARGSQVLIFSNALGLGVSQQGSTAGRYLGCWFIGNLAMKEALAPGNGVQNFICLGGSVGDPANTGVARMQIDPFLSAYTRLRDLRTGMVEAGALTAVSADPWRYYSASRSSMPSEPPDMALTQVQVSLGNGFIGYLPGVFSATPGSNYVPSHLLARLGRGADWTDLALPVEISGENFYLIPGPHGMLFVSTDEVYW